MRAPTFVDEELVCDGNLVTSRRSGRPAGVRAGAWWTPSRATRLEGRPLKVQVD